MKQQITASEAELKKNARIVLERIRYTAKNLGRKIEDYVGLLEIYTHGNCERKKVYDAIAAEKRTSYQLRTSLDAALELGFLDGGTFTMGNGGFEYYKITDKGRHYLDSLITPSQEMFTRFELDSLRKRVGRMCRATRRAVGTRDLREDK